MTITRNTEMEIALRESEERYKNISRPKKLAKEPAWDYQSAMVSLKNIKAK
jgi:hypothetical protein